MGRVARVIATDVEANRLLGERLSALADYSQLEPEIATLCVVVGETAKDPDFPGAFVPVVSATGDLRVFIASPTSTAWRRLSPVLKAFAGPTLTSFDGLPTALPHENSVAAIIFGSAPAATADIRLPADTRSRITALRALARVRDTFARAPKLQRSPHEPTSWLLAQFQDHLNVGRRDAASEILRRLRTELRLDALNLKFLEVQLLATFEDWAGIVAIQGFENLCLTRQTPAVTSILLEALYRVHLEAVFEANERLKTKTRFSEHVRPLAQPMLHMPAPASLGVGGWRIFGLEACISTGRSDIRAGLVGREDELGWLADEVGPAEPVAPLVPATRAVLAPLDEVRNALAAVDTVESVDAMASALEALKKLSPEDLVRIRGAEPFRSLLQTLTLDVTDAELPTSWTAWLSIAGNAAFTNALEIARRGKDEWSIEAETADPVAIRALVSALEATQNADLAAERTLQALPFIVAWLNRDPSFPRPELVPIYSSLITLFALGTMRGRATYESSLVLVNALLTSGLDVKSYRALIADVEEIAGQGLGVDMAYWMLEIVEDFMRASAPDAEARQKFLHGALSKMAPIYTRLSGLQRAAIARLASELGWTLGSFQLNAAPTEFDAFSTRIKGMRIAIYSLTESSSRQAKAAIEEAAPTTVVDCNADHGGTARLRALAENADLFVMTWQSAKHAATDFIREHRAGRPLLYAQGRGFSSILRAIEDYLRRTDLGSGSLPE